MDVWGWFQWFQWFQGEGSRREFICMMLLKMVWWLFSTPFGLFYAESVLMYSGISYEKKVALCRIVEYTGGVLCGTFGTQRHNVVLLY